MANIELNPPSAEAIDALSPQLTADKLEQLLKASRAKIKTVLMDQKLIGGIGNAYADEILHAAQLSPLSIAGKIPKKKVQQLAKAIKDVLEDAERQIQKTHPDIISGEVRDFLKVHRKQAKHDASGQTIKQTKVGGRITYYTADQEEFS